MSGEEEEQYSAHDISINISHAKDNDLGELDFCSKRNTPEKVKEKPEVKENGCQTDKI